MLFPSSKLALILLNRIVILSFLSVLAIMATKDDVVFFYNREFDTCKYHGNDLWAAGSTALGGLCAFDKTADRLYSCSNPG